MIRVQFFKDDVLARELVDEDDMATAWIDYAQLNGLGVEVTLVEDEGYGHGV